MLKKYLLNSNYLLLIFFTTVITFTIMFGLSLFLLLLLPGYLHTIMLLLQSLVIYFTIFYVTNVTVNSPLFLFFLPCQNQSWYIIRWWYYYRHMGRCMLSHRLPALTTSNYVVSLSGTRAILPWRAASSVWLVVRMASGAAILAYFVAQEHKHKLPTTPLIPSLNSPVI